ncbi:23S rRNA (guanosine(2251)-2'-O)-methyltransferase RlmB [Pseudoroseomonas globiformis]|uniref:23S rRNA (Guanosine(2251)-2'-O)-methyltransferase RlmB n=1 Tax=Teichococcus globiformis TaxID=2307229 RepID=A0ABV7FYC1_9PROT
MSRPPRRPEGPRRNTRPDSKPHGAPHGGAPAAPHGNAPAPKPAGSRPQSGRHDVAEAPHRARPGSRPAREGGAEAPFRAAPADPRQPREKLEANTLWLYGLHAVAAALRNPRRRPRRLLLTAEAEQALQALCPRPWAALGANQGRLQPERVERARFQTFLTEDAVHQGVALLAEFLPPADLEDALDASRGTVLLLDQVTDPRNVGAVLRSAAAFGAAAVVMQDRNAPPETGAMARAAAGALDIVPLAREVNLARTIQLLQKRGYWVMGLAAEAEAELARARPRDRPVALVLGAEDTGLRRLQRETCDELVRLPISPVMESLNVSVAAAVALYEVARGEA